MAVLRLVRDVRCPACGRYLGSVSLPETIRAGEADLTVRCPACRKFVRLDQSLCPARPGAERKTA